MTRAGLRTALICVITAALAPTARADAPADPPPEAEPGADFSYETADSLADGAFEVMLGAEGQGRGRSRRLRRVRFRGDGVTGGVRDGSDDPLRGGFIEGTTQVGVVRAGHVAPRWGRGLLLGAAAEPWDVRALDRGRAAFTGRSAEGLSFRGTHDAFELLAGSFDGRGLVGGRARGDSRGIAFMTDARRRAQASAAFERGVAELEVAMDQRGRWRAEALHARPFGRADLTLLARAGAAAFRSLAEPRRAGPSRSVTVAFAQPSEVFGWRALGSAWMLRRGVTGGRAALQGEVQAGAGGAAAGLEVQQGPRRLTRSGGIPLERGVRHGLWAETTLGDGAFALGLREELWISAAPREVVRRASGARLELAAPLGARLRVAHTVFRTGFGESLYLREAYEDRLVLRALSGRGDRTRIELDAAAAGGRLGLSLMLTRAGGRSDRMVWSVDWRKRSARRG